MRKDAGRPHAPVQAQSRRPKSSLGWVTIVALCVGVFVISGLVAGGTIAVVKLFRKPKTQDQADQAKAFIEKEALAEHVQPFLSRHCLSCHSGDKPKGDIALDRYSQTGFADNEHIWVQVVSAVRSGQMPPREKKQRPTSSEIEDFTGWIDGQLAKSDCTKKINPGRVTIRRLNRTEYNNTVHDLVGIHFKPADDFPADDVGYGFDNIGDVLSMPPLLMEKYLAAAEKIADSAILLQAPVKGTTKKYAAKTLKTEPKFPVNGEFRSLYSNGEAFTTHDFPRDGEYILRSRAYADQAGKDLAKLAFRIDGKDIKELEIKSRSGNPEIVEVKTRVKEGKHKVSAAFTNDFYDPKSPNPNERDRNLYVEFIEVQGPLEAPTYPESHRLVVVAQPSASLTRKEAARRVAENFASRAYRRPATSKEVDKLVKLVELAEKNGDSFERGVQLMVQAVLVSPHFLFRIELDAPDAAPGTARTLNEYELATRLSYFLWSTMPDDELFREAKQGTLRQNLEPQVRRMLKDGKSKALVENFAEQWLQTRNLKNSTPDPKLYPGFDESLRNAMLRETDLFFEAVLHEDRSVLEFIDADYTFLNERLAKHYGISGVSGKEFQKVKFTDTRRGGVLTHASVLTITSNPTRTSPVKRGKWIMENILGTPPKPPPPGADDLKEDDQAVASGSLRQRMEQHRKNPNCAVCHVTMDALGFGFENFDGVGSWREKDGSFGIDPAGTLPDGKSFKDPGELRTLLKKRSTEFARCLTEKLLTYALGRGLEHTDRCSVDQIGKALAKNDYKFSTLFVEIARSEPFQKRGSRK